jgi:hypothetical protein
MYTPISRIKINIIMKKFQKIKLINIEYIFLLNNLVDHCSLNCVVGALKVNKDAANALRFPSID